MRSFNVLILAVAAACVAGLRAPGDTRPNIVLFFPDTIAAEAMGPRYGNPVVRTPFFDAFAAKGTLFTTAYSSFPQCSPSRTALVTGVSAPLTSVFLTSGFAILSRFAVECIHE